MPWTPKDADSYTQSVQTGDDKKRWTKVANKVLNSSGDEDEAVTAANKDAEKKQAKKALDGLMDLAKAFDVDLYKTTSGPKKQVHYGSAGFQHMRIRKPGFRRTQFRRERNVNRLTSQGRRNYKSMDADEGDNTEKGNPLEQLEQLAKGVGNNLVAFTQTTTRSHKRKVVSRQNAHRVKANKKRRFKDNSNFPRVS